ncbi:hypothetical protein HUT19_07660 [Streptomyces sp. NA02950]|uniref:hypothetical protein n=1 Tax=Streptomyces sp. NA02950 TaxID=2742137 RepID=UPI00159154BD|nr:hypothetical protein [Streptomyces sp. NA02950]QKV91647.1 hypothetical protein HUT19_07660 [Streptomyces sp. NA02950]
MSQLDTAHSLERLATESRWPLLNVFCALSEREEARRAESKRRLVTELTACNPFRNSTDFEEYRPE